MKMMEKQNYLSGFLTSVFLTGLLVASSSATASENSSEHQIATPTEQTITKPAVAPANESNKKSARPPRTRFGKLRTMIV